MQSVFWSSFHSWRDHQGRERLKKPLKVAEPLTGSMRICALSYHMLTRLWLRWVARQLLGGFPLLSWFHACECLHKPVGVESLGVYFIQGAKGPLKKKHTVGEERRSLDKGFPHVCLWHCLVGQPQQHHIWVIWWPGCNLLHIKIKRARIGKAAAFSVSQEMVMEGQEDDILYVGVSLLGTSPGCFDFAMVGVFVSCMSL
jgi:hypothetical protein